MADEKDTNEKPASENTGKGNHSPPPPKKDDAADIDARIAEAVNKARTEEQEKFTAADKKRTEDAEAAEAKKRGDFEKLLKDETAKRETSDAQLLQLTRKLKAHAVKDQLIEHLHEKHPQYVAVAAYMLPLIAFDEKTADKDIDTSIKAVAEKYVKDNPRTLMHGAPSQPGRGLIPANTAPVKDKNNGDEIPRSPAARGF